jgi:hypothetical protein
MLRHQHLACDNEPVPLPHGLEFLFEDSKRRAAFQQWLPSITTEGNEMETTRFLVTHKPLGHDERSLNLKRPAKVLGGSPFARKKAKDGAPALYWRVNGGCPVPDFTTVRLANLRECFPISNRL